MKKRMIPLLLLLSSHFLLAVYGRDSQKEQSLVVVIAIDGLRWQEVFELIGHTSDLPTHHISSPTVAYRCRAARSCV